MRWILSLPPTVLVLSVISLLNDFSSEMIFPLLPLFLTAELGAGPAFLGLVEGVADATACLMNLGAGRWADRARDRSRLVLAGYGLASGARTLIAAAASPLAVLGIRFVDRVGKGLRTSPRDALLADAVEPARHGRAYGFHRAMDNSGAVLGPLAAAALLSWGLPLRRVFMLSALPAVAVVALAAFKIREPRPEREPAGLEPETLKPPAPELRRYLAVLFFFSLSQSTDAFLLLRASDLGVAARHLPALWAAFHLVKISSGLLFAGLSDARGPRAVIAAGWTVYALSYLGFALASGPGQVWGVLCFYGLYHGLTEGPQRALLARLAGPGGKGAAFGWYHFTTGAALLAASVVFGLIWQTAGPRSAFLAGAGISLAATAAFMSLDLGGGHRRA